MRNVLITTIIYFLTFAQSVNAADTSKSPAVDMVSYEQSWLDNNGTIALKNNTSENIHNVTFMLEYLDMHGNPLDYDTFTYNIDIAPGKTKKLDIPAYEHSRHYHYYKTKDELGNPAFKLRYELKDYNLPQKEKTDTVSTMGQLSARDSSNTTNDEYGYIMIIMILVILGIYVGSYVLVALMAQRRNRNPAMWILLSFFMTPVLICIILLVIGKNHIPEY